MTDAPSDLAQPTPVEAMPIGIALLDADQQIMSCNPAFTAALGLSPGSAASPDLVSAACRSALSRHHRVTVGGSELPDGGSVLCAVDAPSAEAAGTAGPAANAPRLLDVGLSAFGPNGTLLFGNPRLAELLEIPREALQPGLPFAAMLEHAAHSEHLDSQAGASFLAALRGLDTGERNSVCLARPDGQVIEVATDPLPDGGWTFAVANVRRTRHADLAAGDDDWAPEGGPPAVPDALPHAPPGSSRHGILFWSADRTLIAGNDVAAELLGYPPDLLVPGRTEQQFLDDMLARDASGDHEAARALVQALGCRNRSMPFQSYVRTSDRVLDHRSDPAPGGGWISTFTDVTQSVQAAEELRRAKDAAEVANQAKSRFLATMSHELRTPLNAVIGFSDALLREGRQPAPGRVAEFAQQINDAGRLLLGLINIILDVARIESGRFDLSVDRVDIAGLIRDAIHRTDAAAQAAEISVAYELPDVLPVLQGDERRLQQVLGHLLSNAVKFTDAGGSVMVGAKVEPGGTLLIYVCDTGIGIPQTELERVFEPFTQLDSTLARRFQGAGIGLYVARALVRGHGGRLTLKSQPGKGTTAEMRLPPEHLL